MKHKRKILFTLSLILTIGATTPLYAKESFNSTQFNENNISEITEAGTASEKKAVENIYDYFYNTLNSGVSVQSLGIWKNSDTCYGDTLDDVQRIIYDALVNNFDTAKTEVTCTISSNVTRSECEDALEGARQAFFLDYPERFWNDHFEIINFTKNSSGVTLTFQWCSDFYSDLSEVNNKMDSLENKVNNIINDMNSAVTVKSDADKVAYLHNWLLNNVSYHYSADDDGIYEYPDAYTAYGAIVDGRAVCQGYSHALTLLCKEAGITCITVMGYKDGNSHSWNMAKLDGAFYLIDSTNDDNGGYRYRYFLIPESSRFEESLIFNLPTTSNTSYVKYGDVDDDNSISILDANWVIDYSYANNKDVYRNQISEIGFIAADVTGDNSVDADDSDEILNKVLDSMYELPVYDKLG